MCGVHLAYLPPANEVCEGYVFTGVCAQGVWGGHVWRGGVVGVCMAGGMRGRGTCVVGEHAWQEGVLGSRVCMAGACMAGACMAGGYAWQGGMW